MVKFTLIRDKYRKARGGTSRFLDIYCSSCKNHLLLYQKDGPGSLKRMYMDRVFAPQKLTGLQNTPNVKEVRAIRCDSCNSLIATPYIYEKENRKAFLLNPIAFIKKISKGINPPEKLKL